jgi:hypothetical protein
MEPTATSGAAQPSARAADPKDEPRVTLGSRILWYSVGALLFLPPLLAPPWLILEEWQWRRGAFVVEAQVLSTTGIERGTSRTRGRRAWFQRTAQVRFTDATGRVRVATAERPFHASFETQAGGRARGGAASRRPSGPGAAAGAGLALVGAHPAAVRLPGTAARPVPRAARHAAQAAAAFGGSGCGGDDRPLPLSGREDAAATCAARPAPLTWVNAPPRRRRSVVSSRSSAPAGVTPPISPPLRSRSLP